MNNIILFLSDCNKDALKPVFEVRDKKTYLVQLLNTKGDSVLEDLKEQIFERYSILCV